ncbi:MAG: hypothetical protein JNN30_07770 [Rhodanobacteraceae bacterium]|nr:hypothetical protein [Rhodanobacteraceae bacterium]
MTARREATHAELAKVVAWLQQRIIEDARGDGRRSVDKRPSTLFWLGRLAPEVDVMNNALGERGERLEPCAIGMRLRPSGTPPWNCRVVARVAIWAPRGEGYWEKTGPLDVPVDLVVDGTPGTQRMHQDLMTDALRAATGRDDLGLSLDVTVEARADQHVELVVQLVNVSNGTERSADTNLYQCELSFSKLALDPFVMESLPDSFRYDRTFPAIGLNCAVERASTGELRTLDTPESPRLRPVFTPDGLDENLLSFDRLAVDPLASATALLQCHERWGQFHWAVNRLDDRQQSEHWTSEMRRSADAAAVAYRIESQRIADGIRILTDNAEIRRSFQLMNAAMAIAARGRYPGWRAFQLGFLLSNLASIERPDEESAIADIVWFATGGGKTETYLGLLVAAMLYDRMRGKHTGITAWSRFPLRMLSLQQTQRFADAIAAAEIVRRREDIPGAPFSLGFFVGNGATPNAVPIEPDVSKGDPDPNDPNMPAPFQVLERCPFCRSDGLHMGFDQVTWTLQHRCQNPSCPWDAKALPIYVVDEEIYRFLPTVIVGTLDKAALISMQAAMRGFVGPPVGLCSRPGHGFTYSPRSTKPKGCLVPGCKAEAQALPGQPANFAPTFRLQDELHLLRDSLGAVDTHYEALYDHLTEALTGRKAKILASSATLAGYERQVDTLYGRDARVFPQPGPEPGQGFWSSESELLMRHYVAIAPRGVTLEHAIDRVVTVLQGSVRQVLEDPTTTCSDIGIPTDIADQVIDLYGTDVVYGNTLRDLDAVSRSAESQILVKGDVVQRSLTGRTDFADVRNILKELEQPAPSYEDRIHVVTASSMMSHGVDVDRLNVMVMLGMPLGTAEFIQATARVGRKYPGLVILLPKMARERDAGIFRTFPKFVEHADRLVEPIPITRRSRRVLERTISGLAMARVLMVHEPASGQALTTPKWLSAYWRKVGFDPDHESSLLIEALRLDGELDGPMREDIRNWVRRFLENIDNPPAGTRFLSDASPGSKPMRSLRDVEEQVPIYGKEDGA